MKPSPDLHWAHPPSPFALLSRTSGPPPRATSRTPTGHETALHRESCGPCSAACCPTGGDGRLTFMWIDHTECKPLWWLATRQAAPGPGLLPPGGGISCLALARAKLIHDEDERRSVVQQWKENKRRDGLPHPCALSPRQPERSTPGCTEPSTSSPARRPNVPGAGRGLGPSRILSAGSAAALPVESKFSRHWRHRKCRVRIVGPVRAVVE